MSTIEKLKNSIVPSVISGVAAVGIYYLAYDNDLAQLVPFGPLTTSTGVAIAGSVFAGTMVGEVIAQFALPEISKSELLQKYEDYVIPPITAGFGTYIAMMVLVSKDTQLLPSLVVGTGGSIGGKYIYNMI